MPEWVAQTEDEYVHIAVRAARDLPGLARTRAGLRTRLTTSPLGNVKHYTRTVEGAFRSMWIKWCNESFNAGSRQTTPDGR
jgi:predicted O-linked N-acetylglucosamine transferase (SPINDLY family)